jgi:hypothetical protein
MALLSHWSQTGIIFTSHFWKSLFQSLDTKLALTTAYHPQSDGQSERVNQCLEMYLRCAIHDCPAKWKKWLPLAEFWYNTSYHTSIGCSPFKVLYGYDPVFAAAPVLTDEGDTTVHDLLTERQQCSEILKTRLAAAQNRMKIQADKKRSDRVFQEGEMVLLKLQPYVQSSIVNRPCPKLAYKYFGPFKVLEKVGSVAYRLELPENSLVHPVFHVSQLKAFTPNVVPVFSDFSQMVDLSQVDVKPLYIVDWRMVRKGSHAVIQVRVVWSHLPEEAATWEDYEVIKKRFPDALDWGQSSSSEGGDVRDVTD